MILMDTFKACTFLIAASIAVSSPLAEAQNLSDTPLRFDIPGDFMPAMFSSDSKSYLTFAHTDSEKNGSIDIYDGDLQLSAAIPITSNPDAVSRDVYEFRKCEGTWEYTSREQLAQDITAGQASDRVKEWFGGERYVSRTQPDGSTMYVHIEYLINGMPNNYLLYIPTGNNVGDLYSYRHDGLQDFKMLDEWYEPTDIVHERKESYLPFSIRDFDHTSATLGTATATQTLFNSDASYEYLAPVFETYESNNYESDTFRLKTINARIVGLSVMSESGTAQQTVRFDEGLELNNTSLSVLLFGGKRYLSCYVTDHKENYTILYEITGSESRLQQAAAPLKTRVYPTLLKAGESVTIDAGESDATFRIHDINGRNRYSGSIAAGKGISEVPASVMAHGLNIVTVNTPGNAAESTKVIVK